MTHRLRITFFAVLAGLLAGSACAGVEPPAAAATPAASRADVSPTAIPADADAMVRDVAATPTTAATSNTAAASPAPPAAPLALAQRWVHTAGAPLTGLVAFSIDGGPLDDLIAVAADGLIYPVSINNRLYPQGVLDSPLTAVAAGELDGEPVAEIVAGSADGRVALFDTGQLVWSVPVDAPVTALLAGAADGAGARIVAATKAGRVVGLNAAGEVRWSAELGAPVSALAAAGPDVLVVAGGRLVVLRDGALAAEFDAGGLLVLAAAEGPVAALGTAAGDLILWDGQERRRASLGGPARAVAVLASRPPRVAALGGAAGDIVLILAADGPPVAVALDAPATALAAVDLDGDGVAELLAAGPEGVTVIDAEGGLRGVLPLDGPASGVTAADMDHSPTSPLVEIVVWGGEQIRLIDVAPAVSAAEGETPAAGGTPSTPATSSATEDASAPAPLASGLLPYYEIDVTLDYDNHTLTARQTVTVPNTGGEAWTEIVFNVSAAYWELFDLERVTLAGEVSNTGEAIEPEWDGTMLRVPLPRPLLPGKRAVVLLDYTLRLPRLDPYGWGPAGNAGWSPEVTQVGDWYPALVPYIDGEGWRNWRYHPVGDPVISPLADYDVAIVAPTDVVVAAAGPAGRDGPARRFQLDGARSFAFLASRDYVRFEGEAAGVPIRVYTLGRHAAAGPAVVLAAEQAITLFADQFGPYPYGEFVLAENGFLTAIEYSVVVSQSGFAFDSYSGAADSLLIAIVAHEVAHQWWYGAVGNDQVHEPWLDEALSMMSELLFYERYYPDLVDWWWQYRVDQWQPAGPVDATIYDFAGSEAFVHNVYGMGARFMYDLRATVGEEAFGAALRDHFAGQHGRLATGDDFFAAVSRHTTADVASLRAEYFRGE